MSIDLLAVGKHTPETSLAIVRLVKISGITVPLRIAQTQKLKLQWLRLGSVESQVRPHNTKNEGATGKKRGVFAHVLIDSRTANIGCGHIIPK